ncbi:hypothetical protein J5N97_016508 [Dioscorea zingiberensis]|uniref:Uncharacterized protein n=1 Tax=Dioscorea zingiberensis TaxID=325984 RepID=A0A9D5CL85_9LILI|nr:hypothetical protein J5N97_016508 [Dioscorea zingiberensis]
MSETTNSRKKRKKEAKPSLAEKKRRKLLVGESSQARRKIQKAPLLLQVQGDSEESDEEDITVIPPITELGRQYEATSPSLSVELERPQAASEPLQPLSPLPVEPDVEIPHAEMVDLDDELVTIASAPPQASVLPILRTELNSEALVSAQILQKVDRLVQPNEVKGKTLDSLKASRPIHDERTPQRQKRQTSVLIDDAVVAAEAFKAVETRLPGFGREEVAAQLSLVGITAGFWMDYAARLLREEAAGLKQQVADLQAKCQACDELQAKVKSIEAIGVQASERITELESLTADLCSKNSIAELKRKEARSDLVKSEGLLRVTEYNARQLQKQVNNLTSENGGLKQRIKTLEDEKRTISEDSETGKGLIEWYRNRDKELETHQEGLIAEKVAEKFKIELEEYRGGFEWENDLKDAIQEHKESPTFQEWLHKEKEKAITDFRHSGEFKELYKDGAREGFMIFQILAQRQAHLNLANMDWLAALTIYKEMIRKDKEAARVEGKQQEK